MNDNNLRLPTNVVGQTDINRLLRELSSLDDFLLSAAARTAGTSVIPPRITYMLEQVARDNKYNLLEPANRDGLKTQLQAVLKTAPVLHISFATEPSPRVTDAILGWLRANIHSQSLVVIGLQPNIAAGCVLRSGNQIFDMSLRTHLQKQEGYLVKLIEGAASGKR
jgi:F0F1-type ATP synthase delta subunit